MDQAEKLRRLGKRLGVVIVAIGDGHKAGPLIVTAGNAPTGVTP